MAASFGIICFRNISVCMLETSHRFSIKYMQSLPKRTSTDVALSLLNCKSIEYEMTTVS